MQGIFDDFAASLATGIAQNTRPVYNALGRQIGYTVSDQQLALGKLMLFKGEVQAPASEWKVKSYGVIVPAAEYLVKRGLKPAWISEPAAMQLRQETKGSGILPAIELPAVIPSFSDLLPGMPSSIPTGTRMGTYAIWGGVALLGAMILMRPSRR